MNSYEIYKILSKMIRTTKNIQREITILEVRDGLIIDKNSKK